MPATMSSELSSTIEASEPANGIAMASVPTKISMIPRARIQPQFPRMASSS